jgi:serine/threonine-protein kinase RsbW
VHLNRFSVAVRRVTAVSGQPGNGYPALGEAIGNAVIHGNHENPKKWVYVNCRCSVEGEVSITVRDEGEGFDFRSLPDPTDKAHLLLTHGRGIRLMQRLMNDIEFQENGTEVCMRKQLRRQAC